MGRLKQIENGDKRYRFNVPADDPLVQKWIDNQKNVSMSLRVLIKNHVATSGVGDIFSSSLDVPVVPLVIPTISEVIVRQEQVEQPVIVEDVVQTEPEVQVEIMPQPSVQPRVERSIFPKVKPVSAGATKDKLSFMKNAMNDI